jgi:hypothetical protein
MARNGSLASATYRGEKNVEEEEFHIYVYYCTRETSTTSHQVVRLLLEERQVKILYLVRCEVLTAVTMSATVFWDIM